MKVLSIFLLLSYHHLLHAITFPHQHAEIHGRVHQRTSKGKRKEEETLHVQIPAILRYITNRPSSVHKDNNIHGGSNVHNGSNIQKNIKKRKNNNISKQKNRKIQSNITKEQNESFPAKQAYDVTMYNDLTNIPENPFAWTHFQEQSQIRHSISEDKPFVREKAVRLSPTERESKFKDGGLINLSNWTSTTTPKQTSVLLLHHIDFKKLLQYLKNKKKKLEHDLQKQENVRKNKNQNVLEKLKTRLKFRHMHKQQHKTRKSIETQKKKKKKNYVVKTAERNMTVQKTLSENNSHSHSTKNSSSKSEKFSARKTKRRNKLTIKEQKENDSLNNVSSAEELSDIEDDLTDNITEDEKSYNRILTHHSTSSDLPNNTEDKNLSHHDNEHVYQLLRKNRFFDHVMHKKHHQYETRKDEIPHPVNHKTLFITHPVNEGNLFYTRRSELPFYALPANPVPSEQLISFPAQYPELLNLQPMNRLYTSLQGLDTNEESLLGSYLKKERLEEESLQDTDPDKIIRTDDRGNLYQDDILNSHAVPTKIIDQKTMNDISKVDENAISSLARLDKNVLKDTSKAGQNKLMGASLLDQTDVPKGFQSHSEDEENKNFPPKLSANDITAIKKLTSEGILGNTEKTENTVDKVSDVETTKTQTSNASPVSERRKTEREALHLLRNLAIRKKLERIKMLQDKLHLLQRLEASRRKHLMMKPDAIGNPSSLSNVNNRLLPGASPTDPHLLKNFFSPPDNTDIAQTGSIASKNKNSTSMFQDALYDRGKILQWKYRNEAFKNKFKDYLQPSTFDDDHLSKRSRRHRNFHLAGDSNIAITDEGSESNKHQDTTTAKTGNLTKLSQNESYTSGTEDLKHSAEFVSEPDAEVLKHTAEFVSEPDMLAFNGVSHFLKDRHIDETTAENGVTKSMNEFRFNGQIQLDPKYQGNVKIVHGTAPPEFFEEIPTVFPFPTMTTPFNRHVSSPPLRTTSQPTFLNGYPWAWYKSHKKPTNKHLQNPTKAPPTRSVSTSANHFKVTTTRAISSEDTATVASPLAEDYIMQDVGNRTQNNSASTVDRPIMPVDGEVELENENIKTTSNPVKISIETSPPTTPRLVNLTTVKVDDTASFNISSNETTNLPKDSNIYKNSSLVNSNETVIAEKSKSLSEEEYRINDQIKDSSNSKNNSVEEKSKKNANVLEKERATTRGDNITSVSPSPLYVTYEQNSRHHNSLPNDIVLDESKDVETKQNIHNEQGKMKQNDYERRKEFSFNDELSSNKPAEMFLTNEHANVHPHLFLDSPELSNMFHLRAKYGSLYFHEPTHDDEEEMEAGDRRTYQQQFPSHALKELTERGRNNLFQRKSEGTSKSDENLHTDTRVEGALHTNTRLEGTTKSSVGSTSKIEDFENDDKIIERKNTPTVSAFATKSLGVEVEPEVLEDSLLKEYERQSRLNKKYTAEILQNIRKNESSALSETSQTSSSDTSTLSNTSKSQDDVANHMFDDVKSSSPVNKEKEGVSSHIYPNPSIQTTATTTTTTSTTFSSTPPTPPPPTTITTTEILRYKQPDQMTYQKYPYPTIKSVADPNFLLNEANGLHDSNSVNTLNLASNSYAFQPQQPAAQMYVPTAQAAPTAFQAKPTYKTYNAGIKDSSNQNEHRYFGSSAGNVLTIAAPSATTTKSPFEDQLNLEDMYWTDSSDEIENACKQQKGTQLVVNILAFGDSLTRGYYNRGKNHHPYTMKLQYLLNRMDAKKCFIVENEGKDGDLAFGEMPRRIEEVFRNNKKQYDWVIILGGTNDIYNKNHAGRHKAEELTQNILAVHNIAHHHGSRTIAVTIPDVACESSDICQDMKQTRDVVNNNLRSYADAHKNSVLLCDLADSLVRHRISHKLVGQFFEGGLHLKPRGYETMAKLIFEAMKQVLDK